MKNVLSLIAFVLQFLPLTIFLCIAAYHNPAEPQPRDWLSAYMWSGGAASLRIILTKIFLRGTPLNRVILGVDFYLIIGGTAVLTNQIPLLNIFRTLKESGIFLCILAVGLLTFSLSKYGFVGVTDSSPTDGAKPYNLWLLVLAGVCVVASFTFRGNFAYSAAIPLIVLSLASRLFQRHLQKVVTKERR